MAHPTDIPTEVWSAFRSNAMLRAASDEGAAVLARTARLREYAKGQHIFHEGDAAETWGLVVRGHARAVHFDAEGHATTFLTLWPGDGIGARHGLGGLAFPFDVCAEDDVVIAMLPLSSLRDLLLTEPAAALSVIEDLSSQLVNVVDMAKTLRLGVPDRILYYVSRLPRTALAPNSYRVTLPTSRVELAAALGTSPETLSRAFQALKKEGLIRADGTAVTVVDERRLDHRLGN